MTRLMDMSIEPFLVSSVVLVSFAQRLVRKICPHCRTAHIPSEEARRYWHLDGVDVSGFIVGQGCFNCMHTGYKGRTGVYEVLVIDAMIQDMILKRRSAHEINRAAIDAGTFTTLQGQRAREGRAGDHEPRRSRIRRAHVDEGPHAQVQLPGHHRNRCRRQGGDRSRVRRGRLQPAGRARLHPDPGPGEPRPIAVRLGRGHFRCFPASARPS